MPPKRKLPRNARRLPKGTTVNDYEPEVIAEWIRDRNRQYKETHRNRQRHRGIRDVTFALGRDSRVTLTRLCKERGMSKSQLIEHLIQQESIREVPKLVQPQQPT